MAGKFLSLTNVPILTLRMTELGNAMKARGALNTCGLTATIVETAPTTASLELRTAGACVVPITGLSAGTFGSVENYAGEPLTSVTMSAGSIRTIPVN